MNQFLTFIVIGLATGAVYGMAGTGLVLTYKTSGIFNFGYGAVAALDVFVFFFLHDRHGVAWPVAAVICVFVVAPIMGLGLEVLARSLAGASETIKVVATVGLILIVGSVGVLWFSNNAPTIPTFLPQSTVSILGVNITWAQIIVFLFSLTATGVLYWFFQSVRLGIVMRGVVDNHELVSMSGDNPVRVRRWAWIIGTMFASVAGLMLAPGLTLSGTTLTTAVFAAFGAAAIGYFSNLPLTFAGGLLIGVAGALVDKYAATVTWIGGLPPSIPFIVLFVVLIVIPRRRLVQRAVAVQRQVRDTYHAPPRVRLVVAAVAVGLLAIVPTVQAVHLAVWSAALVDMILFLSLGLLVRRSGQISLCHLAFAAVGAAAFGHFAADGLPWLVALLAASLVAVPVGALIAIPAVRVSGIFLALATLGFGILAQEVFYTRSFMFGDLSLGIADPRPNVSIGAWNLSTDTGFYYLLLVIVVLVVVLLTVVGQGRLGRLLEALADSPLALETHGTTSSVLKVIVFCLSAAIAAMAGALTGMLYHYGVGTDFNPFTSLTLVALVVIVTIGDPWYAVLAALGYAVIPGYISSSNTSTVLQLLFGLAAATAAWGTRGGTTPQALRRLLDRWGGRVAPVPAPAVAAAPALAGATTSTTNGAAAPVPAGATVSATVSDTATSAPPAPAGAPQEPAGRTGGPAGLEVRHLSVRFGGVKAVDDVSLKAPMGRITGLIGPNGAGKTTTFNACSGLNRPSSGQVLLHEVDVSGEGPAERARRGLGRTFQRTELFNSLTVRQNVAMGREAGMAGRNPIAQLSGSPRANRAVAAAVDEALAITGTTHLAGMQAGLLTIGQRRMVELARSLCGPFDVLLLDEPSSGLDGHETDRFGTVLRSAVRERGCGILLVEHDMTLVREICEYVYVLDFGSMIFEGTPAEMERSEQVRAAYLGDVAPIPVGSSDGAADGERNRPLATSE